MRVPRRGGADCYSVILRPLFRVTLAVAVGFAGLAVSRDTSGRSWGLSSAHRQSGDSGQQAAAASSPQTPAGGANGLAVGTTICAVLTKTVDAKKAKPGDLVTARATLPVLSHGRVFIANGAKLSGHVTRAKARSSSNPESELWIVFDRVRLKDGGEMRLPLTLQAIGHGAPGLAAQPDSSSSEPYAPDATYGPAGNPGGTHTRSSSTPQPQSHASARPTPTPSSEPAGTSQGRLTLDGGSKGAVGLQDLTLTEGSDTTRGSEIRSSRTNVKLETGSQVVVRVIAEPTASGDSK